MAERNTILAEDAAAPCLEILSGDERGKVFELILERISIGRSDDNEISISSDAISRHHAVIEKSASGSWLISDQGSKNGISINGTRVREAELNQGDVVQVGDFVFRFSLGGAVPESPIEMEGQGEPATAGEGMDAAYQLAGQTSAPRRSFNPRTLILAVVFVGGLLYLFMGNSKPADPNADPSQDTATADGGAATADGKPKSPSDFKETPSPDLKNPNDPPRPVAAEDPSLTDAEQFLSKIDNTNDPLKEGEQFFRRGQREYLNHNYGRAIDDFKTTLSLTRGHEMATKYLALSMHAAEDEAKTHMQNGVRYFDSLQYQRAMYDFQQVIELMAHRPNEPIIGQAEKYIAVCKQRLSAAEQFP